MIRMSASIGEIQLSLSKLIIVEIPTVKYFRKDEISPDAALVAMLLKNAYLQEIVTIKLLCF